MKQSRLAPTLVLWLFPVVAVALLVGVVVGIVMLGSLLFDGISGTRIMLQLVAVPLFGAIALGAVAALKHKPQPAQGVELTEAEHPRLWAEVNELAANAQTAPPARIVVTPDVNAAVAEVSGRRELVVGLPLLATFTTAQLRSVLAHELGHFAGGDTAAAAKDLRRRAFLDHVRVRVGVLWRWFFTAYARLYAVAAGPSSRAAELRADDLSAQAAGPRVAAESFRALLSTDVAWEHVLEKLAPYFPLAGRRASLGEATRQTLVANRSGIDSTVEKIIAEQKPAPTDTHPPVRERIARFEAMAAAGETGRPGPDGDHPAIELLTDGANWLDGAEGKMLAQQLPLVSWDEVIGAGVFGSTAAGADDLASSLRANGVGDGGLDSVVRLIDGDDVVSLVGGNRPDAREATISALSHPILSALLSSGGARVRWGWDAPVRIVGADGSGLDLGERIGAAIDAGDSTSLRSWLADNGVDVANASPATAAAPRWLAAVSQVTGPWEGRRDVHFWTTGILALPQLDKATVKEAKDQFSEKHQHPRLRMAAAKGLEAGKALPGSLWWDGARIVGADVAGRVNAKYRFTLDDATVLELTSTLESASFGSVEDVGFAIRYLTAPKVEASAG